MCTYSTSGCRCSTMPVVRCDSLWMLDDVSKSVSLKIKSNEDASSLRNNNILDGLMTGRALQQKLLVGKAEKMIAYGTPTNQYAAGSPTLNNDQDDSDSPCDAGCEEL